MEELLNKLIEKGWKPRGFEKVYNFGIENGYTVLNTKKANYISFATSCVFREDYQKEQVMGYVSYTYRELVSKESGLWQFVCENGMINNSNFYTREKVDEDRDWIDVTYSTIVEGEKGGHYEYRLIESALKDESELEQFLLDSIKIDE